MNLKKIILPLALSCLWIMPNHSLSQQIPAQVRTLLDELPVLSHPRGDRELLYQYSVGNLSQLSDDDAREVIQEMEKRGIGVITFWKGGKDTDAGIEEAIRIARIQQELGLRVVADASRLLYGFYDNTAKTAHIDEKGETFNDESFGGQVMGCPMTLTDRIPIIKARITAYTEAYKAAGVYLDMVTADWEVDGPIEWNDSWENSKRCTRCRENIPDIHDFLSFQATLRSLRSKLMRDAYSSPILEKFPEALITNYGTYPNDGWRYWYDYFEHPQADLPHKKDQLALYRPWYDEFTETGFTLAMPVVYTWYPTYSWYPAYSDDYKWFYNMLMVGSNAGQSTPSGIPVATFVHWNTTAPPASPDPNVKQMSADAYRELLWHLLLRGHDMLFSWCMPDELAEEMTLLQQVYDESLPYNEWFAKGRPVIFDVPEKEGCVISAIRLNDKLLVRRTDFKKNNKSVTIHVDGVEIKVPYKPNTCQILNL